MILIFVTSLLCLYFCKKLNMKTFVKSILQEITTVVFGMNDIEAIKAYVVHFVEERNIEASDKKSIIVNINACKNIVAAHRYLCNALLKFEGLSVNGYDKKEVKVEKEE